MTLYLPHHSVILRPVDYLLSKLLPRQVERWRRDTERWRDTGRRDTPLPLPLERLFARMGMKLASEELLRVGLVSWDGFVGGAGGTPLPPVGWWSMRATSGTNEPNRGSGGPALDMTITSATLDQVGQLGPHEAALMDGANSLYQTANNAALANLSTWEYVFLVKPTSAGESNFGIFAAWGNGTPIMIASYNNASTAMFTRVSNTVPTTFVTTTTNSLTLNIWSLLFAAYDDSGDRKIHFYKAASATLTELTYSAQPALTGTYLTTILPLNLFNNTAQSGTLAGLGDEALVVNGNLVTATTRTQLMLLAGV